MRGIPPKPSPAFGKGGPCPRAIVAHAVTLLIIKNMENMENQEKKSNASKNVSLKKWAGGERVQMRTNPKTGKMFIACGERTAAIEQKVIDIISTVKKEDLEVSTFVGRSGDIVNCVVLKKEDPNVVREFDFNEEAE